MALQIRRGTYAELQTITPLEGELIYTTDTEEVYVGDGVTQGGILVTGSLADLDISSVDVPIPTTTLKDNNSTGTIVISDGASNYSVRVSTTGTYVTGPLVILTTATITTLRFADGTTQTTADTANPDQALYTTSSVTFANLTITNTATFGTSSYISITGQDDLLIDPEDNTIINSDLYVLGNLQTNGIYLGDNLLQIATANPAYTIATFSTSTTTVFNTATLQQGLFIGTTSNKISYNNLDDILIQSPNKGVIIDSASGLFVAGTSRIHADLIQTNNATSNHLFRITDRDENSLTNFATDGVTVYPPLVSTTTATFNDAVKFAGVAELRAQTTAWGLGATTATILTISSDHSGAHLQVVVGATFGLDSHTEKVTIDILTNGVDVLNAQSAVLSTTSTGICTYTAELSGTDILVKATLQDPVNFIATEANVMAQLLANPMV